MKSTKLKKYQSINKMMKIEPEMNSNDDIKSGQTNLVSTTTGLLPDEMKSNQQLQLKTTNTLSTTTTTTMTKRSLSSWR